MCWCSQNADLIGVATVCPPGSLIWREHRILTRSYKGEIDGKFAPGENVPGFRPIEAQLRLVF